MAFLSRFIGKTIKRSVVTVALCCTAFVCSEPYLDSERTVSKSFLRAAKQVCRSAKNNGSPVLDSFVDFLKVNSKSLKSFGRDFSHTYSAFKKDTSGVSDTYMESIAEHWDRASVFLTPQDNQPSPKREDKKIILEPSPIVLD